MWIHKFTISKDMNNFMEIIGKESFVERMLLNNSIWLTKEEYKLVKMFNKFKKQYFKQITNNVKSIKNPLKESNHIHVVFASQYTSELGEYFMKTHDIDLIMIVNMEKQIVSLRSRNGVDCSKIASYYGGGGNKYTNGFELSNEKISIIFNEIFSKKNN